MSEGQAEAVVGCQMQSLTRQHHVAATIIVALIIVPVAQPLWLPLARSIQAATISL